MKRFVVSAFLFLLLGQTIGAQNKFALLVGINQYQIKDSSGKIVLDPKNALSGKRWLFWKQTKKQLYISFTDGDKKVQEKVKQTAKEWEKYCGKEFIFSDFPNQATEADITISFKDKTSWSLIGTDSKTTVPSMNLGWLTINTSDEEYRRVVLHEFGHALGLVHEHQNPNNNTIQRRHIAHRAIDGAWTAC